MKKIKAFIVCLVIIANAATAQQTDIVGPAGSVDFGKFITVLPNGNFVVIDEKYSEPGLDNIGAVHLYNGATKLLISTLKGTAINDFVGSGGITVLANGNFVISSPEWRFGALSKAGAITWVNATTGLNAAVSATNSVTGGDAFCGTNQKVFGLPNSNYVICMPSWSTLNVFNQKGAIRYCNGSTGAVGIISNANAITGASTNDAIGDGGIKILPNGNYVIVSKAYNLYKSAITLCNGNTGLPTTGSTVIIDATNSLVGRTSGSQSDPVNVHPLTNNNYVVMLSRNSNTTNFYLSTVTLTDGSIIGFADANNSLIPSANYNFLGNYPDVTPLTNGNFVLTTSTANINGIATAGAATWCSGTLVGGIGPNGPLSATNSIIGNKTDDRVGTTCVALTNGNYVVGSTQWSDGINTAVGAATWANGTTATSLVVSAANSLVGARNFDYISTGNNTSNANGITALTNGNYLISSTYYDTYSGTSNTGAVAWGNGSTGTVGVVGSSNALVGVNTNDEVGKVVVPLTNGNYVVGTPSWDYFSLNWGAATWGNGTTGIAGFISPLNSFIGSGQNCETGKSIIALTNGNYVVTSSLNTFGVGNLGATTLCSGTVATANLLSASNSFITTNNQPTSSESIALNNGNYVIVSNGYQGTGSKKNAYTPVSGAIGLFENISDCNSLFCTSAFSYSNPTYDYTNNQLLVGSFGANTVNVYEQATAITLAISNETTTENILAAQPIKIIKGCKLIAGILPNGANPVVGNTTAKVWIEPTQPTQFVKRHYEITPATNTATATAKVTLYFTQQEFDDFNTISALDLPTAANDNTGKANLLIEKRAGTSSDGSGLPNTYSGAITTINPADADIVWNAANNRWEISFDVTGFSGFFVKTVGGTLPIQWLQVQGKILPNQFAQITWKVAENNIAKYEIEKVNTVNQFQSIGTTTSIGNGENHYSFTDQKILNGTALYRIKQTSIDGKINFSSIIKISAVENGNLIIYPNPIKDIATISLGAKKQINATAEIIQVNGAILKTIAVPSETFTINVNALPAGVYILKIVNGKQVITQKMIKE